MPLLNLGGVGVVGQGIFQPPELLARITAKGVDRSPGEEHLALVEKLLPDGGEHKIVLQPASQQLNGVGAAVDEQTQQFVEGVYHGICVVVHHLLEIPHAQQIGLAVQGAAPDINVGTLHVGAIGVAATVCQENNVSTQARVGFQKAIFWPVQNVHRSLLNSKNPPAGAALRTHTWSPHLCPTAARNRSQSPAPHCGKCFLSVRQ